MKLTDEKLESLKTTFRLSPRETELLGLICQGIESNAELAKRLGVTLATVKTYVHDLHAKLGTSTKLALVFMAIEDELNELITRPKKK